MLDASWDHGNPPVASDYFISKKNTVKKRGASWHKETEQVHDFFRLIRRKLFNFCLNDLHFSHLWCKFLKLKYFLRYLQFFKVNKGTVMHTSYFDIFCHTVGPFLCFIVFYH